MKHLLFLLLLIPLGIFGQSVKSVEVVDQWKLITEQDGVKIHAKKVRCEFNSGFDEYSIILKVENTNNFNVTVSFTNDLYYAQDCVNCGFKESEFSYEIAMNSEQEGFCSREENNGLRIWDSFDGYKAKKTLTKFVISHLKIEQK